VIITITKGGGDNQQRKSLLGHCVLLVQEGEVEVHRHDVGEFLRSIGMDFSKKFDVVALMDFFKDCVEQGGIHSKDSKKDGRTRQINKNNNTIKLSRRRSILYLSF